MGQWKLDSVSGIVAPMNANGLYGNDFKVTYKIRYTTTLIGSFTEMPRLDWHEKFIFLDHLKKERWMFEKNMYEHNPSSKTLEIFPRRYIEAYNGASGMPAMIKGSCRLLSKEGVAVPNSKLGNATSDEDKAKQIRNYLKANGGVLEITIHDIPSLNEPTMTTPPPAPGLRVGGHRPVPEHRERLLLFDVGLVGVTAPRWKGHQHLMVSAGLPKTSWVRNASPGWMQADLPLPPGYKNVPPPPLVATPRAATFFSGECW